VNCDVAREALSARIDGEREPVPAARVDEHVAACAACRDWYSRVVAQAQQVRRLAGRSQVAAVPSAQTRAPTARLGSVMPTGRGDWRRWALAAIGVTQLVLAAAQGFGVDVGISAGHDAMGGHDAMMGGHLLNESTAWSAALGAVMVVAALRPTAAAGLAGVLVAFTMVLTVYVAADAVSGAVTLVRVLSHLPVLLGTVLALLVWWAHRVPEPDPRLRPDEIVLPHNATRGRRRGHLWPADDSAAAPRASA
jgi:predicted anti-sigma-YlaC factor YlaD